jgi:DNA mismatch repair ATPase MutS
MDPVKRVDNEIRIREGEFILITGANMAGKSTYLRTIGVNLILAMAGAPVCADAFTFTPIRIFTSIRTADSLQENESYFYAELKRLKVIIENLKNGKKLFIILDEILKGTNSTDKHAGSEALLKQFLSYKTTGIVATHDVSLGSLQERFPENIRNHCFEVDIQGNQLFFDYKLRGGLSKNLNATILMREMGITID